MSFFKKLFKGKEVKKEDVQVVEQSRASEVVQVAEESPTSEAVQVAEEPQASEAVQVAEEPQASEAVQVAEEFQTSKAVQVVEEASIDEDVQIIQESQTNQEDQVDEDGQKNSSTKVGFFKKLVQGLTKTRNNILEGVENVLRAFTKIDEELYEELEEALIMADIGVDTTMNIMEELRMKVKETKTTDPTHLKDMLVDIITSKISKGNHELSIEDGTPTVILVIGVNGVGKTTTIGKLAYQIKRQKKKTLIAAADTFRAAAIEQLQIWGDRSGVDVIKHHEGADPAAVIYDALQAAKARKTEVLICDTAGRLHNKANLMKELEKIFKVIEREYPEANKEVLLVLDATTGQNAVQQAKLFKEVADISGIVLTKLDGTAKGGIIIGIHSSMNIPVKFIGVGEGIDDLQPFDAEQFSKALFCDLNS